MFIFTLFLLFFLLLLLVFLLLASFFFLITTFLLLLGLIRLFLLFLFRSLCFGFALSTLFSKFLFSKFLFGCLFLLLLSVLLRELGNDLQQVPGLLIIFEVLPYGFDELIECLGDCWLEIAWVYLSLQEILLQVRIGIVYPLLALCLHIATPLGRSLYLELRSGLEDDILDVVHNGIADDLLLPAEGFLNLPIDLLRTVLHEDG